MSIDLKSILFHKNNHDAGETEFYALQDSFSKINKQIRELEKYDYQLKFNASTESINQKSLIGELNLSCDFLNDKPLEGFHSSIFNFKDPRVLKVALEYKIADCEFSTNFAKFSPTFFAINLLWKAIFIYNYPSSSKYDKDKVLSVYVVCLSEEKSNETGREFYLEVNASMFEGRSQRERKIFFTNKYGECQGFPQFFTYEEISSKECLGSKSLDKSIEFEIKLNYDEEYKLYRAHRFPDAKY